MTEDAANEGVAAPPVRPVAAVRASLLIPGIVFVIALAVWVWAAQAWLIQDDFVTVLEAPLRWRPWQLRDLFLPLAADQPYLRPLPPLTYYFDELLWGERLVWGWHLTSVLLHAANAAVLAWLLLRIGRGVALLGGVIFAVQPVAAEPVTWISARPDLLMAGAAMLSLGAFARGRRLLSALLFLVALLCKEAAVSTPLIVTAWVLYRRGNVIRETAWHWAAVSLYLIYRLVALHGIGGRDDWATDPGEWAWDIVRAFPFPLPVNIQGWQAPVVLPHGLWAVLALVMVAVAGLVLLRLRHTWLALSGLLLALLPALPLLQLGPSLQFSRYLYFASAFWAAAVALALTSPGASRRRQTTLPAKDLRTRFLETTRQWALPVAASVYVAAALTAGAGPRIQLHQATDAARQISESIRQETGRPAPGARVLVEGVPARVNGWLLFGGYIGTAAYGGAASQDERVRVADQSWLQESGAAPADRDSADIFISVDGPSYEVTACAVRKNAEALFPDRTLVPCLPREDDRIVDLGAVDLFQRAAHGFRWNEGMGSINWAWTVQPDSTLHVRVSAPERKTVTLRVASIAENRLELLVNGESLGVRSVPSGFQWVDVVFFAGNDVWRNTGRQEVVIRAASENGGLYLAVDRLEILPWAPAVRVDFKSTALEEYDPHGISGGDSGGGSDWLWLADGTASIALPFKADDDSHLVLRVASDTGAMLTISIGGREAGAFQVPRGHRWVEGGVYVPKSLWSAGPLQRVFFEASVGGTGGRVALDWIEDRPVEFQSEFNIGEVDAAQHAGRGFGFSGQTSDATFQFMDSDTVALDLPLRTEGNAGRLVFRVASVRGARVYASVNGEPAGSFDLRGGGEFVDAAVLVPRGGWSNGPAQHLELKVARPDESSPLLLDRVFLTPFDASGHVDFGAVDPASAGGFGFGPAQHGAGADWNWAIEEKAGFQMALPTEAPPQEVWFRVMSDSPALARVTANAEPIGPLSVPGGFRWVWRRLNLPERNSGREGRADIELIYEGGGPSRIAVDFVEFRSPLEDSVINFGPADPGEYSGLGFSLPESNGKDDWSWMTAPRASLSAPIARGSPRLLTVRWMSATPNRASVTVNGVKVGESSLPGGYVWRECGFLVPESVISRSAYQDVLFTASDGQDGHYIAIDSLETRDTGGVFQFFLGRQDPGCANLNGWRWAEGDTQRTWRWATAGTADFSYWLDIFPVESVRIVAMSEIENFLRLSVDGVDVGEQRLPGGFQWTEVRYVLPGAVLSGSGVHILRVQSTAEKDGLFFAAESIAFVNK
jgi:hypothetical protein